MPRTAYICKTSGQSAAVVADTELKGSTVTEEKAL
jgi:hypothetical protein